MIKLHARLTSLTLLPVSSGVAICHNMGSDGKAIKKIQREVFQKEKLGELPPTFI